MKTVIVGGVAGGASAAARLRRLNEQAEIILLERGEFISFANCGLPYYVGGEIASERSLKIQTPAKFNARFNVDVRVHSEVLSIDATARQVTVRNHEKEETYDLDYDKLILSPGASPLRPPLPGIESKRVFTLRTIPDAEAIKNFIDEQKPKTCVAVGGGFIGMEMVESLSRAGVQVTVVEAAPHLMAQLDEDMAYIVHQHLRGKGVQLRLGAPLQGFTTKSDGSLEVQTEGGTLPADFALLSIGVRPESTLAKMAGLAVGERGGILVDEHMRTTDPDIYAVGDAVEVRNFVSGKQAMIPLAGPANRQGRIAADNLCGIPSTYKGSQGSAVVRVFDLTVASTGIGEKAAKAAGLAYEKIYLSSPSHATYYPGATYMSIKLLFEKGSGRVLGCQLVGMDGVDKRCDVVATAIRAGMTVEDLVDLELCYAPPYSSAKDPVNMAGFLGQNVLHGLVKQVYWEDVNKLPKDGSVTLLDVRAQNEYRRGGAKGFVNIPLDELRHRLAELDKEKPVYVHCLSGMRSYVACRLLEGHGFSCYNIAGGYELYELLEQERDCD